MRTSPAAAVALGALAIGLTACDDPGKPQATPPSASVGTPTASSRPTAAAGPSLDPANFTITVDNPYFPLAVGSRWVYEQQTADGLERIVVTVTDQTRAVLGVTTAVVRDTVTVDDEVIEDTFDWYAQDEQGNVWYFGEDTREFEDGVAANRKGSFEAGIDGAAPGIVMKAVPKVGDSYDQELAPGVAEDAATVLSVDAGVTVKASAYTGVLKTEDINRLDPGQVEHKYYARGVGNILTMKVGGDDVGQKAELVEFTR